MYKMMNTGIKGTNIQVWRHWCSFGRYETRPIYFDFVSFLESQSTIVDETLSKENIYSNDPKVAELFCKSIQFSDESNVTVIEKYKEFMFDTEYYTHTYSHKLSKKMDFNKAYRHYIQTGSKEKLKITDFVWIDYLFMNPNLIGLGITTADEAVRHWINYGKTEKRKYKL